MPTYIYECPVHGRQEIVKPMAEATRPERCWACRKATVALLNERADRGEVTVDEWIATIDGLSPLRRVYTPPRVQNLSASTGSLKSWGRNMRLEGTMTMAEKIAKTDAARGDNRAATLGEAG